MSFRIFAGNLAFQVTDEDLKTAFSAFGSVTFARVILDKETGKSRGFGFVEMEADDAGKKALASLDNSDLKGRQLRLKEAEPRAPGGPPRSGPPRSGPPRSGAPPREGGSEQLRRRAERKPKPAGGGDREKRLGAPAQGRPVEKVRGGAKNRFGFDDDDDDDIDLFASYHEDADGKDFDLSSIDGVEIGNEDDTGTGSGIQIPTDDDPPQKRVE